MKSIKFGNTSRRKFIKTGAAITVGVATTPACTLESSPDRSKKERGELNEASKKLLDHFNLKYPIFQAAPGGEALAVAVANSGAMGAVSLTWETPENAFDLVTRIKDTTNGNFYANYVLDSEPESLDMALEAGCPIVQFSWGIPNRDLVSRIRSAGARLGIQVASRLNAERALELNPDFMICQGMEAGGHVQAASSLSDTLQEVLEVAEGVPVLAAGGVTTGHDVRQALVAGAAGAVMGTRFMATMESDAHDIYKENLVRAGEHSTAYTICFNNEWNGTHRVLRNRTFLEWEAAGCPQTGKRPGENDVIAKYPGYEPTLRYSIEPPLQGYKGALDEMAMYAGQGVQKIDDLPSAHELIDRLWKEFENS